MVLTAMSWPLTLTPVDFNIPDIVRRCAPSRASASLTDRRMRHTHTRSYGPTWRSLKSFMLRSIAVAEYSGWYEREKALALMGWW